MRALLYLIQTLIGDRFPVPLLIVISGVWLSLGDRQAGLLLLVFAVVWSYWQATVLYYGGTGKAVTTPFRLLLLLVTWMLGCLLVTWVLGSRVYIFHVP